MIKFLSQALQRLRQAVVRWWSPPHETVVVNDVLPKSVKRRTLYVVEDDGFLEQAAMLCPCGCKRLLQMNLIRDERPCWQLTRHEDGTSTLHPSIGRKNDCQAHFWFRRGRVHWCD